MKKLILKIINLILKIFNIKLIKIVDQFDGTYRLTLALMRTILITFLILVQMKDNSQKNLDITVTKVRF